MASTTNNNNNQGTSNQIRAKDGYSLPSSTSNNNNNNNNSNNIISVNNNSFEHQQQQQHNNPLPNKDAVQIHLSSLLLPTTDTVAFSAQNFDLGMSVPFQPYTTPIPTPYKNQNMKTNSNNNNSTISQPCTTSLRSE
eukprot:UN09796